MRLRDYLVERRQRVDLSSDTRYGNQLMGEVWILHDRLEAESLVHARVVAIERQKARSEQEGRGFDSVLRVTAVGDVSELRLRITKDDPPPATYTTAVDP